jgi:tRNA (guanine10-N2)-dimethyltransferase
MRPFFSPISLSPRTARLMINLSGTVKGSTILDPFCGTGGILIEGGILGRRVIGNDFTLSMASGTRINLKYYGIKNSKVFNVDALVLDPGEVVNAIVSDLPYGRNSKVSSKDMLVFYESSMRRMLCLIERGNRMVIMINSPELIRVPDDLELLKTLSFAVHKSLTRHIMVFRKL